MSATTTSAPHAASISSLHNDIIESHIMTRLDGQTLASISCANTTLNSMLETNQRLWLDVCHSTWPSTTNELVSEIISTFSSDGYGPRVFFSESFPLASPDPTTSTSSSISSSHHNKAATWMPSRLISAVDVYYQNNLIFTKIEETETISSWFQCSPFRIDLLDPKDVVPTEIPHPDAEHTCTTLFNNMTLSWILIDPISKHAVNLSSHKPVSVQRHWLSGEVQIRFASVLVGGAHELVRCVIVVNCGKSEGGEMQVRELSLEIEDMDGKHLHGKDSLEILQRVMEGKRGNGVKREKEARKRCKKFEEMKIERKERKLRVEGTLDTLSVIFGLSVFASLFFIFC
ncbi:F-box family protein [Artemisia annua]|uniref:F-box family protein n=1 Tax=Artemisia annua TaxID=35608 RepID=A0A2U1LJ24_ARTAN|nr:F-box family protein [Artemisia annua]